jgi:type II secretory ATPase GspE/PulE/Tfp pilus assembly ATPase PilB-like protein
MFLRKLVESAQSRQAATVDAPRVPPVVVQPPAARAASSHEAAAVGGEIVKRAITRIEDAGEIRAVISEGWGLAANARRYMAVVERADGRVALAWTGSPAHAQVLEFGRKHAAARHVKIDEEWTADPDLLALLQSEGVRLAASQGSRQDDPQALIRADELLSFALREGSSDLHITVRETACVVQMRQFGEMRNVRQMPPDQGRRICVALFNAAQDHGGASQFSDRAMQDAVIEREVMGKNDKMASLRIRYAGAPIYPAGFKVVLRLLRRDAESKAASFVDLGYDADQIRLWEEALALPSGLILLCGTTGSGKSTSLQTALTVGYDMAGGRINMLTIENPPEYRIACADQIPVQESKAHESGFAAALRQAMRMDPDVIMIGEIRDQATAISTQQAVQTGHLAVTTTHADHVVGAVDRVIQLGMERPIVGTEGFLGLVVHQTLVPLLCPHCAIGIDSWQATAEAQGVVKRVVDQVNRHRINLTALRFRGPGCSKCGDNGLIGRTVVAEMMVPDFTMCQHLSHGETNLARAYWRATPVLHREAGVAVGRTLREQAMHHVGTGRVSAMDVEQHIGIKSEETPEDAASRYRAEMQRLGRRVSDSSKSAGGGE